jgi:hypothetical protein
MFSGMARDLMPSVQSDWSDFIATALEPKRERRFKDAEDMLAVLRKLKPSLLQAEGLET